MNYYPFGFWDEPNMFHSLTPLNASTPCSSIDSELLRSMAMKIPNQPNRTLYSGQSKLLLLFPSNAIAQKTWAWQHVGLCPANILSQTHQRQNKLVFNNCVSFEWTTSMSFEGTICMFLQMNLQNVSTNGLYYVSKCRNYVKGFQRWSQSRPEDRHCPVEACMQIAIAL